MNKNHMVSSNESMHAIPRAHEWEMVSGFGLSLAQDRSSQEECVLEPVIAVLKPLGLSQELLREICAAVEQAGESLRNNCPDGRLDYINVRVNVTSQALRSTVNNQAPWRYFLIPQIVSSEPDTIEEPRCYIDLHIYQAP